jgi:hypothetical protein
VSKGRQDLASGCSGVATLTWSREETLETKDFDAIRRCRRAHGVPRALGLTMALASSLAATDFPPTTVMSG